MSRLFAFGCSFTEYHWPTWANALAIDHFDYFENWGLCGGGNLAASLGVVECHNRNHLTEDDTVIVMWSSFTREDRYLDIVYANNLNVGTGWLTPGNIYRQKIYDEQFVDKFCDPTGYLVRDCALIDNTKKYLEQIGCKHHFLTMLDIPLDGSDAFHELGFKEQQVAQLYHQTLKFIKPSAINVVADGDWDNVPEYPDKFNGTRQDRHPLPMEHIKYLETVLPEYPISDTTKTLFDNIQQEVLDSGLKVDDTRLSRWGIDAGLAERF